MNNDHLTLEKIESINKFIEILPLILELRPHLSDVNVEGLFGSLRSENYEMVVLCKQGQPVAFAGFRQYIDLAHGRHIYVDDLVTSETHRSQGLGAALLEKIEELAQKRGIFRLRLCSGLQREAAHRFYDREGWKKKSYSFIKEFIE